MLPYLPCTRLSGGKATQGKGETLLLSVLPVAFVGLFSPENHGNGGSTYPESNGRYTLPGKEGYGASVLPTSVYRA